MNTIITLTETRLIKNPNTKTTYIVDSVEISEVTERQHRLTTCDDTVKWFRRLGGSETVTRGYTCAGYKVVKLVSTLPDKETKIVREFNFKTIEKSNSVDFKNLSLIGKFNSLQSRGLITDELKEKFRTFQTNEIGFTELHNEFNNLNK